MRSPMEESKFKTRLKLATVLGVFIYIDVVLVNYIPKGFEAVRVFKS